MNQPIAGCSSFQYGLVLKKHVVFCSLMTVPCKCLATGKQKLHMKFLFLNGSTESARTSHGFPRTRKALLRPLPLTSGSRCVVMLQLAKMRWVFMDTVNPVPRVQHLSTFKH